MKRLYMLGENKYIIKTSDSYVTGEKKVGAR